MDDTFNFDPVPDDRPDAEVIAIHAGGDALDRSVPRPPKPYDNPSAMYRMDAFMEANLHEPPVLIDGVLPGGSVMVLAGQHKVGKTLMMTQMAMSVASGSPFVGFETAQRKVLYLNYEVAGWSFRNRLQQQLAGFAKESGPEAAEEIRGNLFTQSLPDLRINQPNRLQGLGQWVKDHDIGLIVIDPIRGAFQGNRNSDEDVDRVMQNLLDLVVAPSGAAVVLGHHMRKPPPGERASGSSWEVKGSSSWADAADAIVTLRWDATEKSVRYMAFTLRHFDSPDDITVELNSASLLFQTTTAVLTDRERLRRAFQVEEHGLPELTLTLDEIADRVGRPKSTVQRWLTNGENPVLREGTGKATVYRWEHTA